MVAKLKQVGHSTAKETNPIRLPPPPILLSLQATQSLTEKNPLRARNNDAPG
jgi:hypothetical protein